MDKYINKIIVYLQGGKLIMRFGWLQLSDLHIYDNVNWTIAENAFKLLRKKEKINFILVTGDLHEYKNDYTKTIIFLNKLLDCFELTKRDIFIIPGNHDSYTYSGKDADCEYIENHIDSNPECYKEYFDDDHLIKSFKKYNNFIKDFYEEEYDKIFNNSPEQVFVRNYHDKISIIHINTAINCNGNNTLKQIVDISQLSNINNMLLPEIPKLVIAHHPFENIHKTHRDFLKRYFIDWDLSCYLCGDIHHKKFSAIEMQNGKTIPCIVCSKIGMDYDDDYSDLGFIVYSKIENSNMVEVHPYKWNDQKKRFDRDHDMDDDEGPRKFELFVDKKKEINTISLVNDNVLDDNESIWLPDAEKATGTQARFKTYTKTDKIQEIIRCASNYSGIRAVKGIGKTFVMQIKRNSMKENKSNLCLPVLEKATKDNNFGTDTIVLTDNIELKGLSDINNVILIWKYSIIVYVINQLIYIKDNMPKERQWWEDDYVSEVLIKKVEKYYDNNQISKNTYNYCMNSDFYNLETIFSNILYSHDWVSQCKNDLRCLYLLKKAIEQVLNRLQKEKVCVFIDKVDQSIRQLNAEPPSSCDICHRRDNVNNCNKIEKGDEYCRNNPACSLDCCYGCDNYANEYSATNLRIYPQIKKLNHISIWQYLQIGLLRAVDDIKTKFMGIIDVYFTIRSEAFSCERGLLGEHAKKVLSIVSDLWYKKSEQYQIYCDCIKHQNPKYLFDPNNDNIEEAFVGVSRLCNPFATELDESVFDCIYRHSFDSSRDIQEYAQMLTNHLNDLRKCETVLDRGNKVKELIEEKAQKLAYDHKALTEIDITCYYVEKIRLLPNYWANPNNFEKLLQLFDRNLLLKRDITKICKKINGITKCVANNNCENCNVKYYPFSMLYELGMLGIIRLKNNYSEYIIQQFKHSKEVTYILGNNILKVGSDIIFVLHPALTKSIQVLKQKKIKHFKGFIIGKDNKVSCEYIEQLLKDYKNLSISDFNSKYYYDKF